MPNQQFDYPRIYWVREKTSLKERPHEPTAKRPDLKDHIAIDYPPMSDDASHAWHVLSRFEACVMDHNLAKTTASRSPGNNMRADALRRSRALDPHAVHPSTAGPVR